MLSIGIGSEGFGDFAATSPVGGLVSYSCRAPSGLVDAPLVGAASIGS